MINLLDNLDELGLNTGIQLEEFLDYFRKSRKHVYAYVTPEELKKFLRQDYIRRSSMEKKADFFTTYVMAKRNYTE